MAEGTGKTVLLLVLLCHFNGAQSLATISPNCSVLPEDPIPGQLCLDIDGALDELGSGMSLSLEPGTHIINKPHFIDTRNFSNVSIMGSGVGETTISCNHAVGLAFIGMDNLAIMDLTITNCGLTGVNLNFSLTLLKEALNLWFLVPLTTKLALFIGDCKNVTIQDVHITNTKGLGLLGINVLGNSRLTRVNFTKNTRPRCLNSEPTLPSLISPNISDQVGGGAYFLYTDYDSPTWVIDHVYMSLRESYFAYNSDCTYASVISTNFPLFTNFSSNSGGRSLYQYAIGAGGGLSIVLANSNFAVNVVVTNTIFYRNDARYGGGAYVATFAGFQIPITVSFSNCTFEENGVVVQSDDESALYETHCRGGGGLAIFTDLVKPEHFLQPILSPNHRVSIRVADTDFTGNQAEREGGGVMAYSFFTTPHRNYDLNNPNHFSIFWEFTNTVFTGNSARYSSAVFLTQVVTLGISGSVLVLFRELTVSRNYYRRGQGNFLSSDEKASAVHLNAVACSFFSTTANTFTENQGSALRAESTKVAVLYNTPLIFKQNLAHRGGAIFLTGNSPIISLFPNATLQFINNRAIIEGGAIYYDSSSTAFETLHPANLFDCFIVTPFFSSSSVPDQSFGLLSTNISISFANNTAPLGGTVFGATLESCPWAQHIPRRNGTSLYAVLQGYTTFSFAEEPVGRSMVSTPPADLNVTPLSPDTDLTVRLFPGQTVDVGIEVFDAYNTTIPAVVTSAIDQTGVSAQSTLGSSGFWHTSVYQSELRVTGIYEGLLNVSVLTETSSLSSTFSVYLVPCPIGFFIDSGSQRCTCDKFLVNASDMVCFDNTVSFTTLENHWIGTDPSISNPNSSDLIIHSCLLNYCKALVNNTVSPPEFETQCGFNRAGLLCGDCQVGYSNVFGTNECLKCSNYWLFLIPVVAIAGAILFITIAILETTIDKAWTNVIIFFVSTISFLDYLSPNPTYSYTFIPSRLIGLQIGVSVCFYDGMTDLHRSFILLAFPLYLYILMAIFTILCQRFTWMSIHFSPAKTLATLTVMCYLSVLTTSLDIVSPIRIATVGGEASYRWLINPNQRYFDREHGLLVMLGIVIILLYIIPFPLLLLCPSLVYRYAKRLSPFFDILWAAYKPRFRFWIGIRVLLLIVFYVTARNSTQYALTFSGVFIILFSHVQTQIQPLKDKWANRADTVLMAIVILVFWGARAVPETVYTNNYTTKVLADTYLAVVNVVRYSVFLLLFALHIHRQFPSLWTRMYKNVMKGKASVPPSVPSPLTSSLAPHTASRDGLELQLDEAAAASRTSLYIRQQPSPTQYPGMRLDASRYRESILSELAESI